jgi:8-amino-7-oxononanoate synthase
MIQNQSHINKTAISLSHHLPDKLKNKLKVRNESDSLRKLSSITTGVDFYSNDYLGLAKNKNILNASHQFLQDHDFLQNGSSGSRLLSGNHPLFKQLESQLAQLHQSESGLLFNSGYDANLGLLSSVPQRGDIVLYDKLSHASIRDGIRLSYAKAIGFEHNDLLSLEKKLIKYSEHENSDIYIVTESVFSMDGDSPDLSKLVELSKKYQARLIIDEAHALGVFGYGLVQNLNLQDSVFARVVTFGKALGCHGAVILGSVELNDYLVNFARSFIYTTALAPITLAHIILAYDHLNQIQCELLSSNISYFKKLIKRLDLQDLFIESNSAIQSCIISGNERVKSIALKIQENHFVVKPILSPTVAKGQERLRFCLHSFNSKDEITSVLELLKMHI